MPMDPAPKGILKVEEKPLPTVEEKEFLGTVRVPVKSVPELQSAEPGAVVELVISVEVTDIHEDEFGQFVSGEIRDFGYLTREESLEAMEARINADASE